LSLKGQKNVKTHVGREKVRGGSTVKSAAGAGGVIYGLPSSGGRREESWGKSARDFCKMPGSSEGRETRGGRLSANTVRLEGEFPENDALKGRGGKRSCQRGSLSDNTYWGGKAERSAAGSATSA